MPESAQYNRYILSYEIYFGRKQKLKCLKQYIVVMKKKKIQIDRIKLRKKKFFKRKFFKT